MAADALEDWFLTLCKHHRISIDKEMFRGTHPPFRMELMIVILL